MSPRRDPSRAAGTSRHGWWASFSESIETRLWPLPVTVVIAAVMLGIFLPRIDLLVDSRLPTAVDSAVFNGGADTARSVLSSIAGSLITATSLTFSLTVVALQLASSQASPRVLRLFARDRQVHWTLAAFLGTFAYSVTVLRSVRSETASAPEFVPRLSVTLAFVLTLISVIMLVFFLAHLAAQLRVDTMLKEIHAETDRTIDLIAERNAAATGHPDPNPPTRSGHPVTSTSSGFITRHDHEYLVRIADDRGLVIKEAKSVGENIVSGMPLAFWWFADGEAAEADTDDVAEAIRSGYHIGYERTASEDIDFGVQQIVDIALRALSPGVNDPTTAVHALGHVSALIARVSNTISLPAGLKGSDGTLRLITNPRAVEQAVDSALSPLRHYGAEHPAVVIRFIQTCNELSALSPQRSIDSALIAQLDALREQLQASTSDPVARAHLLALTADARTHISDAGAAMLPSRTRPTS